jgi:hypothetical protein
MDFESARAGSSQKCASHDEELFEAMAMEDPRSVLSHLLLV